MWIELLHFNPLESWRLHCSNLLSPTQQIHRMGVLEKEHNIKRTCPLILILTLFKGCNNHT